MAGLFSKAKKYMGDPKYRFIIKRNKGEYDSLGDEEFIRKQFKAYMGYELDLDNDLIPPIPVTKTYESNVLARFNSDILPRQPLK